MCFTKFSHQSFFFLFVIASFNLFAESGLSINPSETQLIESNFVDNNQCLSCHATEANEWQTSHHAKAMAEASDKSVLADFNNITFIHNDRVATFFKSKNDYMANLIGPDNKRADFKIKYTFGYAPLQQYIIELDNGHLQALDIAWDTRSKEVGGQKWFQLNPEEVSKPGEAIHWTGRAYNWNNRCAECHSTNLKKNYDLPTHSYNSTWSEINVSCQSCHGAGDKHVEWTMLSDADKSDEQNKGLIVNNLTRNSHQQVDTCARCHSRRHQVSPDNRLGGEFLDNYMPEMLSEGLYHPDGQILDEVFVYGSFLQSKMYQKGVSCLDCHNPHTGKVKFTDNSLCLQCHQASPPTERFSSLKSKTYDSPEHHFHNKGSEGALCVNCHMPSKVYMEVDPRRDHSFKIPNSALSEKIGTPNACMSCHADKSNEWASAKLVEWYGVKANSEIMFAEVIYSAQRGHSDLLPDILEIISRPNTTSIAKASLIEQLTKYMSDPKAIEATIDGINNDDPLIRAIATNNLSYIPMKYRMPLAVPLFDDPIRAVRINSARAMAMMPAQAFGESEHAYNVVKYVDRYNRI